MDAGGGAYSSRTAEEVFRDFRGRRAGMIKALTTDVEKFYQQCDPEKENLCLYGLPNETWEVTLPAEEVPPELPEPALGINFARDGMEEKDWLALVAVHSDAWLLAVAFYFGARFGFDKESRRRLFNMINNLPTIYEVVTGTVKKQSKEKTSNSSSKSKSSSKMFAAYDSQDRWSPKPRLQRYHLQKMMKIVGQMTRKMKRTMRTLYAVPVATIMVLMNSGYAVTFVKGGSMESVSGSHLPELSTSNSTNARVAAPTRGPEHEARIVLDLDSSSAMSNSGSKLHSQQAAGKPEPII